MFTYCTQVLHLAEHAAYNRIEAARTARRFPLTLTLLADGRVHLSAVRLLAPHLTKENHADVLREATHKSKREIEQIVARLQPRPDVVPSIRRLPTTHMPLASAQPTVQTGSIAIPATSVVIPPPPRAEVAPLAAAPRTIGTRLNETRTGNLDDGGGRPDRTALTSFGMGPEQPPSPPFGGRNPG